MTSKARRLTATVKRDESDEDVSLKRADSMTDSDYELDWSYTARCAKEWSDDELLSHLCAKAFTIPPRDYNPSAPFVYVRMEDGDITTLPHGYRLPLMFITKYQWETTTRTLSLQNRQRWEAVRDEIFHLSRLCHVLFLKARAKAESSGMEKGWRCIIFDRVLTRFYKGWPVSSPAKLEAFISNFGSKEYDKDILKNDWKRWALKGFFRSSSSPTIHLTEEDVNDGITAVDLKMRLSKIDNVWTLSTGTKNNSKRRPIKFIQPADCSSSDLTDLDLSDLDESVPITPNSSPKLCLPLVAETPSKRGREISEDEDRSGKRAKLEEIIYSISSQPTTPVPLPNSGDEEDNPLPKFKAPRHILDSYGWKRLSTVDDSVRRRDEEEEEEAEAIVVPACGFGDSSASIRISPTTTPVPRPLKHSDYPMNDSSCSNGNVLNGAHPLPRSSLQEKTSTTSLSTPSISSKSKGKQSETASINSTAATVTVTTTATGSTFRNFRNSAYVSIPSSSGLMKSRTRPLASASAPVSTPVLESSRLPFSSAVDEKGGGGTAKSVSSRAVKPKSETKQENIPRARRQKVLLIPQSRDGEGAGDDTSHSNKGKDVKTKEKGRGKVKVRTGKGKKSVKDLEKRSGVRDPGPSSSLPGTSTNINDEDEHDFELFAMWDPPNAISSSSMTSLSSLTPSIPSGPSASLIMNNGVATANSSIGGESELGSEQMKKRIRGLKTKFLGFKDDLGKIIGRLEFLEGVKGGEREREREVIQDGDLRRGSVDGGGLNSHRGFISQGSQTEAKRKRKEGDVEMMSGSVYVDAGVGVDALEVSTDACVQTDEPTQAYHSTASTAATVQSVDVSSSTDELANVTKNLGKIKPTVVLQESKTDNIFPPQTPLTATTSSLSSIVDNLVSIKMLSMMQTLVKSSIGGNGNGKAKLVDGATTNANANANNTTESDSDILRQPSPSSSSLSLSATNHSMDAYDNIMVNLLDELKTIKEEARCREQSEKEDLLAMRQLHSAEVDALRRRLSYLEAGNLKWENNGGMGGSGSGNGQWRGTSSMRVDDSLDLDRHPHHPHHPHHRFFEDNTDRRTSFRLGQQQSQYGERSQQSHHFQQNGLVRHSPSTSSTVNPESESTRMDNNTTTPQSSCTPLFLRKINSLREVPPPPPLITGDSTMNAMPEGSLPTPTASDRNHSFGFSKTFHHHQHHGMDLDDDIIANPLPLPVKSQRKHMMALARAHFS